MDATAGLVAATLLAVARHGHGAAPAAALVREAHRLDPPVQHTRRTTAAPLALTGAEVPAGADVVVLLAAATRDPAVFDDPDAFAPGRSARTPFGFGGGRHACPGAAAAETLAVALVTAVLEAGLGVPPEPPRYESRPNLRIPAVLVLQ